MTKRKRQRKLWSVARIRHPQHPHFAIRITELTKGGDLYFVRMVGGRQKMALLDPRVTRLGLGASAKAQEQSARAKAFEIIEALAEGVGNELPADTGTALTLGGLTDLYQEHGLHGVGASYRRDQLAKLRRISAFLGPERLVVSLCRSDVEAFTAARLLHVTRNTVHGDVLALKISLNFALEHKRADGQVLLDRNPLAKVRVPRDTPRRPWVAVERYEALRAVATELPPAFACLLALAWHCGHRIGAILALRWRDIDFATSEQCPSGSVRWYAGAVTNNKREDHVAAMHPGAAAALSKWREECPGIATALVFAARRTPGAPLGKWIVKQWLRQAEDLAQLEHEPGGAWHAFRRGWATARKHLPLVDVAAGGGWRDTATVLKCYQHSDEKGTLAAILNTA